MFFNTRDIEVQYININIENNYYAEFKVLGVYRGKEINENIIITVKELIKYKIIKDENISLYDFLNIIKTIKDNYNRKKIMKMMVDIAYNNKLRNEKELEELKLIIELYKPKQNNEKSNIIGYNKDGNYVYKKNFF